MGRGKYPADLLGTDMIWTYFTWCPQYENLYENLYFPGKLEKFKYNDAWNSEGQIIATTSGKTGQKAERKLLVLAVSDLMVTPENRQAQRSSPICFGHKTGCGYGFKPSGAFPSVKASLCRI